MINKKGDFNYLLLIGLIIFLVVVAIIFKTTLKEKTEKENKWNKGEIKESLNSKITKNNNKKTNKDTDTLDTNTGGGGGGGGGASQSSTNSNTQNCITRAIYYSVESGGKNETCLEYNDSICIKRQVYCKAIIKNEDTVSANFELELSFVPDGYDKETGAIERLTKSFTLKTKETGIIDGTIIIESQNETGIANNFINCFTKTLNDREQEVCT